MNKIFSNNSDIDKNAYLNWRTQKHTPIKNMINIADGFMSSAMLLAEEELEDNDDKKADIIIFPLLFNVNHGIELYLKAITWMLNILLKTNRKIEGSHNIKQIYDVVSSRVNEFEKGKEKKDSFDKLTLNLKEYINELFSKIEDSSNNIYKDNMDFSRYPFNQKYVNHFYIDEFNNVVIDLENFIVRFREIHKNLRIIAEHYLFDYLEAEHE